MNIEDFRSRMKLSEEQFQKLKEKTLMMSYNKQTKIKTKFDVSTKKIVVC
jgi:hypothetical protein